MTIKNEETKEIKLTELSTIDLSGGFICDVETGICGSNEEPTVETVEENKNADNDMV